MTTEVYAAWRRRKGNRPGPWQKTIIPPGKKGDVFRAVCDLELSGSDEWEYVLAPEGRMPEDGPAWTRKKRVGI